MEVYENGILTIKNETLNIIGKTVNLSNIAILEVIALKRHSPVAYLKLWFKGFIILVIICLFWRPIATFGDFYLLTIIPLMIYNLYNWSQKYYGLIIETPQTKICLKSKDVFFLHKLKNIIEDAINNKKSEYTINLKNSFINNGIINHGDNNINEVKNV